MIHSPQSTLHHIFQMLQIVVYLIDEKRFKTRKPEDKKCFGNNCLGISGHTFKGIQID